MRKTIAGTISLGMLLIGGVTLAVPSPKYFVCKFVGTPGVNETLQTGQNPISVSGNALTPPIVIGGYFNDAQGRSYVVAEDTGQAEPTCPAQNPTPPPTPPVVPPTPPTTPPVTLSTVVNETPRVQGTQTTAPDPNTFVGK